MAKAGKGGPTVSAVKAALANQKSDPNLARAEQIFRDLLDRFTERADELDFKVSKAAEAQLRKHYLKQFYFALQFKPVNYEQSRPVLMTLATVLAQVTVGYAEDRGESEALHPRDVHLATFDVDCPSLEIADPRGEGPGLRVDWCN